MQRAKKFKEFYLQHLTSPKAQLIVGGRIKVVFCIGLHCVVIYRAGLHWFFKNWLSISRIFNFSYKNSLVHIYFFLIWLIFFYKIKITRGDNLLFRLSLISFLFSSIIFLFFLFRSNFFLADKKSPKFRVFSAKIVQIPRETESRATLVYFPIG